MEEFTRFVREALRQHVNDQVRSRLQSAMLPDSEEERAPEEEAAHESDYKPPNGPPDFSVFANWKQTEANEELLGFFMALHDWVLALGDDVRVDPVKTAIIFKRGKRNVVSVRPRPLKALLLARVPYYPDVPLREGLRDVRNVGGPSPKGLEITVRNQDDLEAAKELIERSYIDPGERGG